VACTRPLKAYRAPGGGIVFDSKRGFGDRPLELPCGQCIDCRVERSRQWAIRCVHEAQIHVPTCNCGCQRGEAPRNCFITLTYSTPPSDGGLRVDHWQKFAKRLRKEAGPFRFFHCGEYGERNKRPHYHACVFGLDFSSDRIFLKESGGGRLYTSPTLERVWGHGLTSVGDLTYESAAYVARYCVGKLTGEKGAVEYGRYDSRTGECWQVRPPYTTMSRRPGVGSAWFDRFASDVYPSDEVIHKGRRFRPPRFYDKKLSEEELSGLQAKRRRSVEGRKEELTYDRLKAREEFSTERVKRSIRDV